MALRVLTEQFEDRAGKFLAIKAWIRVKVVDVSVEV